MSAYDHVSMNGIERNDDGFAFIRCECGVHLGPVPGAEEAVDMAMEHSYQAAVTEQAKS